MKAYSYLRFSSEKQREGDSIRRQIDATRAWVKRNPDYTLDETTSFRDESRSAFKGEHLGEGGKLNLFLRMVDDGKISRASALIVESFDRLSRLPLLEANELLSGILRRGLTLIFLSPERVLSSKTIKDSPFSLIEVLITGIRSHEESQTKSKRVKAAVERRREQTKDGKKLESLCPPWLDYRAGSYAANPDKVEVIKRIFDLYLSGSGPYIISRTLNAEGVPTFGRGNTKSTKGLSSQWYKVIIKRLLGDKRLLGYCGFNQVDDYFPAVIDEDTFYRAQSRAVRKLAPGRKNNGPSNLFKGLCRCGKCDGAVTRADKERFGYLHHYLVCENGRTGKGCRYMSFKYRWLENSFFNLIDSPLFYGSVSESEPTTEQDAIRGQLAEATKQREKYFKLIEDDDTPSPMLKSQFKKWEAEADTLAAKLDVAKGLDLDRLNDIPEIAELANNLAGWLADPEKRQRIAGYVKSRLDRIVIRYGESEFPAYTAYFKQGGVYTVTIIPHGRRKDWEFQIRRGSQIAFDPRRIAFSGEP
jgi:DNA invertase Pin-like site-specific DNA recombinase